MKWSLFNWKKPVVSSGEPEDYQVVKNTVSQNERNITNLNNRVIQVDNRIDTATANMVLTNTAQTITGAKTLSQPLTLTSTNGALAFKPGTNQPGFIEFYNSTTRIGYVGKGSSQNNNIVIGSQFGDIVFEPATNNGIIIPEPRNNNNPATKQYVDNKETTINSDISNINNQITTINNSVNTLNTFKTTVENSLGFNIRYQDLTIGNATIYQGTWGEFYRYNFRISTIQETKFLAATIHFQGQTFNEKIARNYDFSYGTTWGPNIWFSLVKLNDSAYPTPTWSQTFVRIFYIDTLNSRTQNPYFIVEEN